MRTDWDRAFVAEVPWDRQIDWDDGWYYALVVPCRGHRMGLTKIQDFAWCCGGYLTLVAHVPAALLDPRAQPQEICCQTLVEFVAANRHLIVLLLDRDLCEQVMVEDLHTAIRCW